MRDKWFISDTHFFHDNIIKYCKRPFKDAQEMNEHMILEWNRLVKPQDYVYHLGDVACGYGGDDDKLMRLLSRLNGHKRLIVGNHDNLKSKALHNNFEKIMYWHGFKEANFTVTHVPHELVSLRDGAYNVHGHIHNNLREDKHYINVCVEHRLYRPTHMDEIIEEIKKNA